MVAFLLFLTVVITSACIMMQRRSRIGTEQVEANAGMGPEVVHGPPKAAFQSDEEQQVQHQQQTQNYGVTVY